MLTVREVVNGNGSGYVLANLYIASIRTRTTTLRLRRNVVERRLGWEGCCRQWLNDDLNCAPETALIVASLLRTHGTI